MCTWTEDCDGNWETTCGEMFSFTDGSPTDNGARFCLYCGDRLEPVPFVEVVDHDTADTP